MSGGSTAFGRVLLALSLIATLSASPADARRGGSFGSRGSRTYYSPRATSLSPGYVPPVSRSMTARPGDAPNSYAPSYARTPYPQSRPGLFHGFGGGLLTGLVAGGLLGHLFGHSYGYGYGGGYGSGGGFLATLFQFAVFGGLIWLVLRFFRGRSSRAAPAPVVSQPYYGGPANGGAMAPPAGAPPSISASDQQSFERLLGELQDAFGHEDYRRLREITTPEVMSYLAEELSDNATHGRRNEVTGTRLLDGEVSEAWSEDGQDFATIVMRYESIDVMKDRATGALLQGDPRQPSETTELWTFVRPAGGWNAWKVSAIQES